MKHYQKLAQGSSAVLSGTTSLPTFSSRKHANTDILAEPLRSVFSRKNNNVLTSAGACSPLLTNPLQQQLTPKKQACAYLI